MGLLVQLTADMKTAMKAKDKETLSVIRMVKSALSNEQIKLGHDLTDEDEMTVLSREMKQRVEEKTSYQEAGRDDLVAGIQNQIDVLEKYMPEQLSEAEVEKIVQETITQVGATSKADMGKVMGALMPKVKGKADGKMVSQKVQTLL
ncbi:GatB/YqeY domain-containing protein [Weissella sagaensis]|uniref:GatB/YqeY domain-containing protein n=1 Tax=Weissella sagaensis TaxID=2559928 RepID=A0ABW1RTE1_9LACO|nr:GatB/YqeY domain-containing protein [Weissella sagaensis]KAA8431788.1 GatB/YqeY domain-containing protein [Weissella paramesenteroides]MBU7568387.1 GatB/YqeY domain-containing protein [Weissella hellenica]KAA8437898.1 GatB/YqeY domain-containing protein [Weissella paramesenteroides]QDJ59048.1 GatB/YqeY domain-containing protein [Weissella hellenica]QEA56371.1 GatB/YqeY domain-containing protein [Weissella hellenica]